MLKRIIKIESLIKKMKLSETENNIINNINIKVEEFIRNDSFYSSINIYPENKSCNYENYIVTEEYNLNYILENISYICYSKGKKNNKKKIVSNKNNIKDTNNKDNNNL